MRSNDLGVAPDQRQLRRDPGVGDHDVEPAELADRRLDGVVDLLAVADVALVPGRAAAVRRHALELLGLEPEQSDARAALVQPPCGPGPDPARRPGDQHAAAGEAHVTSLAFMRSNSSSVIVPFSWRSASLVSSSAGDEAASRMYESTCCLASASAASARSRMPPPRTIR